MGRQEQRAANTAAVSGPRPPGGPSRSRIMLEVTKASVAPAADLRKDREVRGNSDGQRPKSTITARTWVARSQDPPRGEQRVGQE